jgi:Ca2+/H+ antiporter
MLGPVSERKESEPAPRSATGFLASTRDEFALGIGLGTAAIFYAAGNRLVEDITHPFGLIGIFLWLFMVILWAALSVVRHADCLAIKCGEPYGTLILTLAAISIEVVMISTAMLHGANNPTLARDAMFAVIMIALNGLVGLSLLLGGLRHREQHYNLQGTNSYLNVIMALAVLGLVLPNFTTSTSGPTFSTHQEIFLMVTSAGLYAIFLLIQTMRHSQYFMESQDYPKQSSAAFSKHSARFSAGNDWTDYSSSPDDRAHHETISHTRSGRRQSSAPPVNTRREPGHVCQRQNECFTGLHPPSAVRGVFIADIFPLRRALR